MNKDFLHKKKKINLYKKVTLIKSFCKKDKMLEFILLVIGLVLLVKGADVFVDKSSLLARNLGVSSLSIGLTLVSFGTSLPELLVSVISAWKKTTDIAIGNIVGANIANILLILGIVLMMTPLTLKKATIWREIPISFFAALFLLIAVNKTFFDYQGKITRIEGIIMLSFFVLFIYHIRMLIKDRKTKYINDKKAQNITHIELYGKIILGLAALYLGGQWVVNGVVEIAQQLGVSQFLISSTIVAVGTTLPELFTAIAAIRKKEFDLAIGNIIGSNIFNILFILGITSVITSISHPISANFNIIFLIFTTLLIFLFLFIGEKYKLKKWHGLVFLFLYGIYLAYLI